MIATRTRMRARAGIGPMNSSVRGRTTTPVRVAPGQGVDGPTQARPIGLRRRRGLRLNRGPLLKRGLGLKRDRTPIALLPLGPGLSDARRTAL